MHRNMHFHSVTSLLILYAFQTRYNTAFLQWGSDRKQKAERYRENLSRDSRRHGMEDRQVVQLQRAGEGHADATCGVTSWRVWQ